MNHAETIAKAIQAAWRGEPMPEPGTPARDALEAAVQDSMGDEALRNLGLQTLLALVEHMLGDLMAHREVTKMQLAIRRGQMPAGRH